MAHGMGDGERLLFKIVIVFQCVCLVLFPITLVLLLCKFKSRRQARFEFGTCEISLRAFTYKELEVATWEFSEPIGKGSSGTVYRGVLCDGTMAAVKELEKVIVEGEKEFRVEMKSIGRTHHRNLVQMLGFCKEGPHRLLVYEFMSNGSLSEFLFRDSRPGWKQRTEIARGIARGLLYLHEECRHQIIHCDIKPQNVLIDEVFVPKISDFGIAKLLGFDQSKTLTITRGTAGYLAPEWLKDMPVSAKVDVYSYGVVLLEILFCKERMRMEDPKDLVERVYLCFRGGEIGKMLEGEEEGMQSLANTKKMGEELQRFVKVGLCCVCENPKTRPTMRDVTLMLEGLIEAADPLVCSSMRSVSSSSMEWDGSP